MSNLCVLIKCNWATLFLDNFINLVTLWLKRERNRKRKNLHWNFKVIKFVFSVWERKTSGFLQYIQRNLLMGLQWNQKIPVNLIGNLIFIYIKKRNSNLCTTCPTKKNAKSLFKCKKSEDFKKNCADRMILFGIN